MRELWAKIDVNMVQDEKNKLIRSTHDICTAYIVEPQDADLARKNGARNIVTTARDANILLVENVDDVARVKEENKTTCAIVTVESKEDEKKIIDLAESLTDYIVAKFLDWRVIPLENLIAQVHGKSRLLAFASNAQEAKLALETLEMGTDGIVAEITDVEEIMKIHDAIKGATSRISEAEAAEKIVLCTAEVVEVKPLGSGARVCIDTTDIMKDGEGLLVGCQSSGLFLVQAEVYETPFVASRPFRVNAGSIALYVLAPSGRTRYLSELKAGDEVLVVDRSGRRRTTNICRVKIEWRPLILIEAEWKDKRVKTMLQNAETIRVVTEDGTKSVSGLSKGDKVLVHVEEGGRHFGTLVKEEKVIER